MLAETIFITNFIQGRMNNYNKKNTPNIKAMSSEMIVHKLLEEGITMEDLVIVSLLDHPAYDVFRYELKQYCNKICFFISNIIGKEIIPIRIEEYYNAQEREKYKSYRPNASYISTFLIKHGITMKQMVEGILIYHQDYYENIEYRKSYKKILKKIDIIVCYFMGHSFDYINENLKEFIM